MDPNAYVNVVVVYPVLAKLLPNPTPDSGYPPGGIHPRNVKGAALVQTDDAAASADNTIVIHFPKHGDNSFAKQQAVALANAAQSGWTNAQLNALQQSVDDLAAQFRRGSPPAND